MSPHPDDRSEPHDDDDVASQVVDLIRSAAGGAVSAGRWSVASAADGIDHAVAPLVASRIRSAVERGGVGPDRNALERSLRDARSTQLGGKLANSAVPRIARRLAPLRAATRRSPVGMALWVGPGLVSAVSQGLREIEVVAAHLGARARRAGRTPDVDAIHAATVAVLGRQQPSAVSDDGPDHRAMLGRWLRAGAGSVVPFGLAGRADRVEDIADRLAGIDDESLGTGGAGRS